MCVHPTRTHAVRVVRVSKRARLGWELNRERGGRTDTERDPYSTMSRKRVEGALPPVLFPHCKPKHPLQHMYWMDGTDVADVERNKRELGPS